MQKIAATIIASIALLALPATSNAHRELTPSERIKQAVGPGTTVWGCRPHGHGTLCEYKTPWGNVEYENGATAQTFWYSAAVVERGVVRFP
jgi:hypothetical protein